MSADETDEGPLGIEVSVKTDSSSLLHDEFSPEVVTNDIYLHYMKVP